MEYRKSKTFKCLRHTYAEKSKLQFLKLNVNTELIADINELKKPVMKNCTLNVFISGASNPERIKMIAEKAFQSGFILNSVKTEVSLNLQIN